VATPGTSAAFAPGPIDALADKLAISPGEQSDLGRRGCATLGPVDYLELRAFRSNERVIVRPSDEEESGS
jgi:hypothetical protein